MKRTKVVGILDGRAVTATWDATPAAGTVVEDLGHGVTVVLRDPPPEREGLPAGRVWIAPYAVNCKTHGWQVSRRYADECAREGRAHIRKEHAGEVIVTRVWRDGLPADEQAAKAAVAEWATANLPGQV